MRLAQQNRIAGRSPALALGVVIAVASPAVATAAKRPAPRPNLVVESVADPPALGPANSLAVFAKIRNTGTATARASLTRFLLSLDERPGEDDIALNPADVRTRGLKRGRGVLLEPVLAAPWLREGAYHLIACADLDRVVRESSERDNCRASTGVLTISYGG